MAKLENKIALVTGASRGIGAAIAKKLVAEGAEVIVTARSVKGLEEVDDYANKLGKKVTIVPLNLMEFEKINLLAYEIAKKFGKLDILIGNAGTVGTLAPVSHIDPKIWDRTIGTNLTANYHLIRSMDSLLRLSNEARAIFVTDSSRVKEKEAYFSAYSASKAALEALVESYAKEMKTTNVKVKLFDPGTVATKLYKEIMPGIDQTKMIQPEEICDKFLDLLLEPVSA